MMEIYAFARSFMARHGNPDQWGPTHWPPEELIRRDIAEGRSYVCVNDGGTVIGTFFFTHGADIEPTYREITDGAWLDGSPYGVVHRIASDGSEKGVGAFCLNWAYEQCGHLRIDTHGDNTVMQNLVRKLGFVHCGTIYVEEDDAPRLAYEKSGKTTGSGRTMEMERKLLLNRDWHFGTGVFDLGKRARGDLGSRLVNLPHDFMIETDTDPEVPSGAASGYYNAGVAHYIRELDIPQAWEGEKIFLRLDGAMMNATVEVNGNRVMLQHNGYIPFEADITGCVYPGERNRIVVTVNASMQPNSRWYSGAGLFRGVELVHTPKLHIAFGGLYGRTVKIDRAPDGSAETAFLQVSAEIENEHTENRVARVRFSLVREDTGEEVIARDALVQAPAFSRATAYTTLTVDGPRLWSAETPRLYRLRAQVTEKAVYRTHMVPVKHPSTDAEDVLFGIRTVEADVKHGLRINGREVKLKGGCLHHDNGVIGAVSVYDAEAWKVRKLREIGFNAIRTTHNPPSAALIEACDRLGMYVFDEAFDAWGMGKQPGDYNQYFDTDWEKDLTAFVRRDRCHPCVVIWSTGNEITERAGLNNGYVWATRLAETIRRLDPGRPVSNGICSFWNGLDDALQTAEFRRMADPDGQVVQNADAGGKENLLWEEYTEAFANGLDIAGYNYLEDRYETDHRLFPERVILGSENYPKEIGVHWPMIEKTPWVIGDFTWTAWDYIGEAGIGKTVFLDPDDPRIQGAFNPWEFGSPYPWRTANDSDFDIIGRVRPQGIYRRIVWGSGETALFSYDPANYGKAEGISPWGFPAVRPCWNWQGREGMPVRVAVFSAAEETELFLNGNSLGRRKAGEAAVHGLPYTFLFETEYAPGTLEAVSYQDGREVSRASLATTGPVKAIRLVKETEGLRADGLSLAYVRVLLTDGEGRTVPDAAVKLTAEVSGQAELLGFGSGNPITAENYTKGCFTSYRGQALAVLRAGYEAGEARLAVAAEDAGSAEITLAVTPAEGRKE